MQRKNLRMLDAFAGIGGFHLGVQEACDTLGITMTCVGAIEFDKQAQTTYNNNFPDTPLLGTGVGGDITQMDLSTLPQHDLLCGGFPCQPFSRARHNRSEAAGIHAAQKDDRIDLFTYLCQIIAIHQPRYVFFENVPGILKETYDDGTKVIDKILAAITRQGYDVKHFVVDAKDCGAPQVRKRVIILGTLGERHVLQKFNTSFSIKDYKCIRDILESNVDAKYLLKDLWNDIPNHRLPGSRYDAILKAYSSHKWTKPTQKQRKVVTSARVEGDTPSGYSRQRDRVFNSLGLSPTLTCSTPLSISIDKDNVLRQLTPREYARIQCFPNTFKIPLKDSVGYKQFGNAVCVDMVNQITQRLVTL